jgi:thiamine-monophosphate kinase
MGIGEFNLIHACFAGQGGNPAPGTRVGIGDDASVHRLDKGMELVVSTDSSIESIHWPHDFPLSKAADRAVCAALSDLAAMGAKPMNVWLNVMARDSKEVSEMAEGATAALQRYDIELAGGDTCHAPVNGLSVTVAGQVPEGAAMLRSEANEGDAIWIVGKIGFHSLGLQQWMGGKKSGYFVNYLDEIKPKLEAGVRLRELGVKCCIDISDGLLQDAGHIADASRIAMDIDLGLLPGWDILCEKAGEAHAIKAVATGGEDYALLLTAPESMRFLEGFAVRVGHCATGSGVSLRVQDRQIDMQEIGTKGYDHFA